MAGSSCCGRERGAGRGKRIRASSGRDGYSWSGGEGLHGSQECAATTRETRHAQDGNTSQLPSVLDKAGLRAQPGVCVLVLMFRRAGCVVLGRRVTARG